MNITALFALIATQAAPPGPVTPPAPAAPSAPIAPSGDPAPPSLDDALGIEGTEPGDAPAGDLDAALAGTPPKDILESALADMRRSSKLLDERKAGLPTRRVQESVVRKLDELIATAQRMQQQQQQQQQQQGQSSSQQQRRGRQGQQQDQEQRDGQRRGADEPRPDGADGSRQRDQAADGEQRGRRDGAAREADASQPPSTIDPTDTAAQFDESRVEWGQLPPRVRDAVRQGVRDPMSAAYRRLTQEYYRRLAEEGRK
jgi:hypothetical protein